MQAPAPAAADDDGHDLGKTIHGSSPAGRPRLDQEAGVPQASSRWQLLCEVMAHPWPNY